MNAKELIMIVIGGVLTAYAVRSLGLLTPAPQGPGGQGGYLENPDLGGYTDPATGNRVTDPTTSYTWEDTWNALLGSAGAALANDWRIDESLAAGPPAPEDIWAWDLSNAGAGITNHDIGG